ncbi:TonB-dependent receptor [Novosphingobium sp. Fuku2-ISO-50]|uniref:TonB-dependent receptor n=1 Tax=Novosphingobium sp. Fuku2-ISO-50 TaxID=1739114 RepID=UPI00076D3131|nr:TonB-dependent receptor [Novosphingobium sp. Fuku2-ISO-50]KUR79636.1 TonB-dependent receptor [Novosphingobium sp. Fuku2-ISO-50]
MRDTTRMARSLALLLASGSAAAFVATPALAQTAAPAADTASANASGEIVVTAQKRSESIQHVPISMQALGAATLEQHQVQSFDDYAKQLPSVSFQSMGPGQSQLFFRGITSGGDGLPFGALPTSGVYLDEIPVTTIGALLDVHVYDMQRVEALSGPQGTLFGASSLSGTLRMITNKPVLDKLEGSFDVTADKYGKGNAGATVEGMINVPVAHGVAVRAVGFYEHDGGYIDNLPGSRTYNRTYTDPNNKDNTLTSPMTVTNSAYAKNNYNDVDSYGGRIALGIELENGWKITPQLIAQHMHSNGTFLYDPAVGDLAVHDYTPEYNIDEWFQAGLTIEGKIGDWDLLYSGGYMKRKINTAADYSYYTVAYASHPGYTYFTDSNGKNIDPTQQFTSIQRLTKQSHELRINSPSSSPVRVTAGLFYQRQTNHANLNYFIPGVSAASQASTVYGDDVFVTNAYVTDRDYAAYGQANFDLTSKLTLTTGIRGFIYTNSLDGFSGYSSAATNAGCTVPLATLDSCNNAIDKRSHGSGETHKINLTWQIDTDHMLYATYSTGFRPGGNNRYAGINPYKPDTLDNFELGWKTSWFNHMLRFNGAVYYEKWKDLQYALQLSGAGITNIYNAGDARVYGVEMDAQLRPMKGLTLSASGAYNDAALTTDFCSISPTTGNPDCANGTLAAPAGTRLPVQPRFKMSANARYEFPVGSIDAFVQGSMNTQSNSTSLLGVNDNATFGNSAGFTTADFSVGGKKGNYTFQLFIQNAFDKRGSLSHNAQISPADIENNPSLGIAHFSRIYPIKPQYFGIKVGTKF